MVTPSTMWQISGTWAPRWLPVHVTSKGTNHCHGMLFGSWNAFGSVLTYQYLTKVRLFNTTCVTILLYGCESWVISQEMESRINAFATSCYPIMLSIRCTDHVPNTIYAMTTPLFNHVKSRQLRFLGHILRLPDEEPARLYALYTPPHGRRQAGRPRTLWPTFNGC